MIDLKIFFPNVVIAGEGILENIVDQINRLKGSKILIITDCNIGKLPFIKSIEELILSCGFNLVIWDKVRPNPDLALIKEALNFLKKNNCNLIIGIGGGSVLDTAKAVSVIAENGGNIKECLGLFKVKNKGLPLILVPTTAGTGSEATHISVLLDEKTNQKVAIYSEFNMADTVFIDYQLTYNLPPKITAETGIDALAHAIEAFVSNRANFFSDLVAISAIEKIGKNIEKAFLAGNKDKEARKEMAIGSFYAGMSICGAGMGAAHGLAYPLIDYGLSHGRSVGIFLPWVMKYNLDSAKNKFSVIAMALNKKPVKLSEDKAANKSIEAVMKILENLEISYRLRDYGINFENLDKMAEGAFKSSKRLFESNPRSVSLEDARAIYKEAF